ncbi:MAG TPA: HD domain-containing protein [Hydrogenophaga sp.]|nr:HD domain-containing protein [Hydrogenophaga sp.]
MNVHPVDAIADLLQRQGARQYGSEAVSQLDHALQCAHLAEAAGETAETIVAALLHDLGHLLRADAEPTEPGQKQRDDLHQVIALPFLRPLFSDAVLEPIRLHVDAKRHLCRTDASYLAQLSLASIRSLELQGGVFSAQQAIDFMNQAHAATALRLRRYDDRAKTPGASTPPLAHYMGLMHRVAKEAHPTGMQDISSN